MRLNFVAGSGRRAFLTSTSKRGGLTMSVIRTFSGCGRRCSGHAMSRVRVGSAPGPTTGRSGTSRGRRAGPTSGGIGAPRAGPTRRPGTSMAGAPTGGPRSAGPTGAGPATISASGPVCGVRMFYAGTRLNSGTTRVMGLGGLNGGVSRVVRGK